MENLEDILEQVGDAGRFQVVLVIAASIPPLWQAWSMLEMVFANHVPKWCCPLDNTTGPTDTHCDVNGDLQNFDKTCQVNGTSCSERVFAVGEYTVINEWDLVCERKWIAPMLTSIQMAGLVLGSILAGQMANTLGRKMTLCISIDCIFITNIVAGFSTSWEMFMAVRFFIGIAMGLYTVIKLPYLLEFISPSRRSIPAMFPIFQVAGVLMALFCWLVPDWRWQHWFCAIMTAPCMLAHFFFPQSLRWLAVKGKVEEAMKVVEQIARWNRRPIPQGCKAVLKIVGEQARREKEKTTYTYMDIFKGWHFFKTSLLLQIVWFMMSMCSYGITFGASALKLGVYLNLLLLSLSSIPALLVQTFVIERVGRKKATAICFGITSVLGITSFIIKTTVSEDVHTRDLVVNILCIIARVCLSAAWAAISVLTTEIYPTVIRTLGFAAANTVCRLGAVLAPFALNFEDYPSIALLVVGGGILVCTVAVMLVDETGGKVMPDTFTFQSTNRDVSTIIPLKKSPISDDNQKKTSPLV